MEKGDSSLEGDYRGNVTVRRQQKSKSLKMADPCTADLELERGTESLFLDSILTQTETEEVVKMLELEGLTMDKHNRDYQFTSMEMGGKEHGWRSYGLLSPI